MEKAFQKDPERDLNRRMLDSCCLMQNWELDVFRQSGRASNVCIRLLKSRGAQEVIETIENCRPLRGPDLQARTVQLRYRG